MKLAQLSQSVPVTGGGANPDSRKGERVRLGPRRVSLTNTLNPDAPYALQELLDAVQQLAQGGFEGEEAMQEAACALARDLERLGPEARNLIQKDRLPAWHALDTEA